MYASSSAVYNASDPSPAPGDRRHEPVDALRRLQARRRGHRPRLLRGRRRIVDRPAPLRRLRPGRDQGMTSGPTAAMLAAARGEAAHIGFSGVAQYDYAPDVARAAVTAAHASAGGAAVYNTPGALADVADIVAAIHEPCPKPRSPGAAIRCRSRRSSRRSGSTATSARSRARRSQRAWRRRSSGSGSSRPGDRLKPAAAASGFGSLRPALRRMPPRQSEEHEELRRQEAARARARH